MDSQACVGGDAKQCTELHDLCKSEEKAVCEELTNACRDGSKLACALGEKLGRY